MYQLKEQGKAPEKQLNEVEIGNLPEKRIQNNDSEDDSGPRKKNGGKDQKDARNVSQTPRGIKAQTPRRIKEQINRDDNTITEMKNTLEGIQSRIIEAEEQISDLEDRMVEFTATEQN